MPKSKFNQHGENAKNKKHFLETGKPKVSEEGLIDIEAEMSNICASVRDIHGERSITSKLKDDGPISSP